MNTGVQIRMSRLFNAATGKSVIVAVDHGIEGVPRGLEDPRQKVQGPVGRPKQRSIDGSLR
jgi:DhnA family fructose-bisphosphate aldolase class Ia